MRQLRTILIFINLIFLIGLLALWGRCVNCGYDPIAGAGRCPECRAVSPPATAN